MEFSHSIEDFTNFNDDAIGNFLDEEFPQELFDDLMNNMPGMGFDMNSLSSDDSGRSSSSYDDIASNRLDAMNDQTSMDVSHFDGFIKEEKVNTKTDMTNNNVIPNVRVTPPLSQPQPIFVQQAFQQPQQVILSQPNIVVKQEPLKMQIPSSHQQILTLQNIGGNLFTTVTTTASAASVPNQTPVHTIVNGTAGILTKIPIVPVTRIMSQSPTATINVSPPTAPKTTPKESKKSGHNIIERRYRTSIVSIVFCPFCLTLTICLF